MKFSLMLNRIIGWLFAAMFAVILFLDFFLDQTDYETGFGYIFPNIVILIVGIIVFSIYFFVKNKNDLTKKKFVIILLMSSVMIFLLQLLIQKYAFFKTGWDVEALEYYANSFIENGTYENHYLTRYPNNLFLFCIFVAIKMLLPFGNGSVGLLLVNALLVSLSGIFTCLAVKNFTNSYKKGLLSYVITAPLILLSPWIIIPYSDTFAVLFPILLIYLYSCQKKRYWHYFLISFFGIIGYFIKPTVVIVLIAIVIVECINNFDIIKRVKSLNYKRIILCFSCITIGVLAAFGVRAIGLAAVKFEPAPEIYEFNWTHFLKMGQNNESNGMYCHSDVIYSNDNGMGDNLKIFWERIAARPLKDNIDFLVDKNLINYNHGTFAWAFEGNFYSHVPESKSRITDFLRSFLYSTGENHKYYAQFIQIIWILTLTFCPFIVKKKNLKKELVVMLSLMGITIFLLLFEARARYLYCYAPVFVLCCIVGAGNLKQFLRGVWSGRKKCASEDERGAAKIFLARLGFGRAKI